MTRCRPAFCAALLFIGAAVAAASQTLPAAGPERPLTERGPRVPVGGIGLLGFAGEVAFWSDPRHGSSVFFSNTPTASPELSGEPFLPLHEFSSYLRIVPVDGRYLMVIGSQRDGFGFFVLPLDSDGRALRETPEKIWSPNLTAIFDVASRGSDALIAWTEGSSIRTLQVDGDGRLLEWSAPAEDYAGRIKGFDLARVGSGYLLLVSVFEEPGRFSCRAIPLSGDGEPAGPAVLVLEAEKSRRARLSGGDSNALLVLAEQNLHGLVLEPSGKIAASRLLVSGPESMESYMWTFSVGERPDGWNLAWAQPSTSLGIEPLSLSLASIDSSGEIGGARVIAFDGVPSRILLADGDSPLLGVSVTIERQRTKTILLRAMPGEDWSLSTISSLQRQKLESADTNDHAIAVVWREDERVSAPEPAHLVVVDDAGSREIMVDPNIAAVAGARDEFLVSSVETIDALSKKFTARWIDRSGLLSEPFVIADNYFAALVQEWSGNQLLSFWSDHVAVYPNLVYDDIYVSSILTTVATEPRIFWMQHIAGMEDALCTDSGCLAAWNVVDYSDDCAFCQIPSWSLVGRITVSGDLVDPPHILAEESREMVLVPVRDGALAISRRGMRLEATRLTADGEPGESFELGPIPKDSQAVASALGDAALVVWEQEGDLVGRVIDPSGSPGPMTPLATSPLPETSPQLVVVEGTTYLLYERIDEEAGGVPRIFMRSLFLNDRRPAVRRR